MTDPRDDRTAIICSYCRAIIAPWVLDLSKGLCPVCGFRLAEYVATKRYKPPETEPPPETPETTETEAAP